MAIQVHPRANKRMPCDLTVEGRRQSGIVLNVSRSGLYVQGNVAARPGSIVAVDLKPPSRSRAIAVKATVVWKRVVPPLLRGVAHGGAGLQIAEACDSYVALVDDILSGGAEAVPAVAQLRFRVRLAFSRGPRTRTVEILGRDDEEARRLALAEAGDGWSVRECTRL